MVVRGLGSANRLFSRPGDDTSSVLDEAKKAEGKDLPFEGSVALALESDDPQADFRRSMEEVVAAHGMRDWKRLEALQVWYLRANGKKTDEFMFEAFVDLLVGLAYPIILCRRRRHQLLLLLLPLQLRLWRSKKMKEFSFSSFFILLLVPLFYFFVFFTRALLQRAESFFFPFSLLTSPGASLFFFLEDSSSKSFSSFSTAESSPLFLFFSLCSSLHFLFFAESSSHFLYFSLCSFSLHFFFFLLSLFHFSLPSYFFTHGSSFCFLLLLSSFFYLTAHLSFISLLLANLLSLFLLPESPFYQCVASTFSI